MILWVGLRAKDFLGRADIMLPAPLDSEQFQFR
jgi:hypothetical protein